MHLRTSTLLLCILGMGLVTAKFEDCPSRPPSWFQSFYLKCCYGEPQLPNNCECFSIKKSSGFTNTAYTKPLCPKKMSARFLLYSQNNKADFHQVTVENIATYENYFTPGLPIIFIVHGFQDRAPNDWSPPMKDAILDKEDAIVVLVDWREGAKASGFLVYSQAVANVRTVGAMIAKFAKVLVDDHGVSYDDVHLVGHSLGAHACGMAGKEVTRLTGQTIGRISGLDPAGPSFEHVQTHVRLDKSDATFVDVIHTDAEPLLSSGFGIRKDIGDVDFWPNGGEHQPSCPKEFGLFSLSQYTGDQSVGICSHMRALDYFTNSVSTCPYDLEGCKMGYNANKQDCSGRKELETSADAPYC